MNLDDEELIRAIRRAGEVPTPPAREQAFARAMPPATVQSRRRISRTFIGLIAAALITAPAAVLAAHVSHAPPAVVSPISGEKPDSGRSITSESDDNSARTRTISSVSPSRSDDAVQSEHGDTTEHTTIDSGADGSTSSSDDSRESPSPSPSLSETQSEVPSGDGGTTSSDG